MTEEKIRQLENQLSDYIASHRSIPYGYYEKVEGYESQIKSLYKTLKYERLDNLIKKCHYFEGEDRLNLIQIVLDSVLDDRFKETNDGFTWEPACSGYRIINLDGNVVHCYDYKEDVQMGNIFTDGVHVINKVEE